MRDRIGQFLSKLSSSLDTTNKGFSARKLSALITMIMVVIIHIKWLKSEQWIYIAEILGLDFLFILTLLGLATWQAVKEKNIQENSEK